MFIKNFTCGPVETNCYLVGCNKTHEAIVIDAPQGALAKIVQEKEWHVKALFITHSHWDHIVDAAEIQQTLKIPLYIHPYDQENLKKPGLDQLPLFFPIEGTVADGLLEEGENFQVGTLEFQVVETPGHSPGGVCFWFSKEKTLFSGDTLFQGAMGRVDFPTSDRFQMWESLRKLGKLPPETKVYPGHGDVTTIGAEKWIERANSEED